jgi:hypothetical protein
MKREFDPEGAIPEQPLPLGEGILHHFGRLGGGDFLVPGLDTPAASKDLLASTTASLRGEADKVLPKLHLFPRLQRLTLCVSSMDSMFQFQFSPPRQPYIPVSPRLCAHVTHLALRVSVPGVDLFALVNALGLSNKLQTLDFECESTSSLCNLLFNAPLPVFQHVTRLVLKVNTAPNLWQKSLPAIMDSMPNLVTLKIGSTLEPDMATLRAVCRLKVFEAPRVNDIPLLDAVDFPPPETVKFRVLNNALRERVKHILQHGSEYARAWAVAALMHCESSMDGTLRLSHCKCYM